jgi:hypothetical protein
MIELDLAAAANQNATTGKVRFSWRGGRIQFDEQKLFDLIARGLAGRISANLSRGLRPDGAGPMPGRQKDGLPRGMGSAVVRQIQAIQVGPMRWSIAAHREIPGQLARILREIPLRAPPLSSLRDVVKQALRAAVRIGGGR